MKKCLNSENSGGAQIYMKSDFIPEDW